MTTNLKWREEIDAALKYLHEVQKIKGWNQIAQKLNQIYGGPLRIGKQCRERYTNLIKFKDTSLIWTSSQIQILKKQFLENGPKWSNISLKISGKSQNSIKNKFNADLRKFLRRLNKASKKLKLKQRKKISCDWFQRLIKAVFESNDAHKKFHASELMSKIVVLMFEQKQNSTISYQEALAQELLKLICNYNVKFLFLKGKIKKAESSRKRQSSTLSSFFEEDGRNFSFKQKCLDLEQNSHQDKNEEQIVEDDDMHSSKNSHLDHSINFMHQEFTPIQNFEHISEIWATDNMIFPQ